ncbi:MAG: GNAT family N-acetyltransferase [Candidatus Brocadiae bacterium]|nr:GNAT family N-acetyltransferase [Candidatus Brocadiia bacterium]
MSTAPGPTPRLTFREFRLEDLDVLAAMYTDPETTQWLGDGTPRDRAATQREIERNLTLYASRGLGAWVVEGAGGVFLGHCGLQPLDDGSDIGLSYAVVPAHRGRGYALEAAAAVLDHGFGPLGLRRIAAVVQPSNGASVGVLKRLGLRFEREGMHYGKRVLVFATTREAHASGGGARGPVLSFRATAGGTTVQVRDAGLSELQREWRIAVDGADRGVLRAAWWDAPVVAIGAREVILAAGRSLVVVPIRAGAPRDFAVGEAVEDARETDEGWWLVHTTSLSLWNASTGATLRAVAFPPGGRWAGWGEEGPRCRLPDGSTAELPLTGSGSVS